MRRRSTAFDDFAGSPHGTTYDGANRPEQVTDTGLAGTGQLVTDLGLDADGQVTGINLTGQTDYAGSAFSSNYTVTNASMGWLGNRTDFQHDAAGRIVAASKVIGGTTGQ